MLELRGNNKEELEEYSILLNNPKLDINLKEKLIQQVETIVDDISTITGLDEAHLLFKYSKVRPTWKNVQAMFANDSDLLSTSVINFLNQENNAIILSKSRMETVANEDGVSIYSKLCEALIHEKILMMYHINYLHNPFHGATIVLSLVQYLLKG